MIDKITFLHFLTAALVIETFMLYLFRFTKSPFTGIAINRWYNNIGIVAVLLDVLSFIIGFYLAKFLYEYLSYHKYITDKYQFWKFLGLVLFIQILHDFGFYFTIIKNTNYGTNIVVDEFKRYAQSVSYGAVIGDSFMYLVATPILYYIVTKKTNDINIFVSLVCSYLIGYFLYQKPIIKM
jgi:hypothetical protein